ncbi:ImmA/IrrE family metallo-endopeptidase [Liquorilactobacillus sicerae]|uniref:ImmA/IrrE family metallo-endopeptidase n=1 Tax=Liquorilactobacillus sicerae TaxID=1416943 RepID=UPI002480A6CC|nr:ImmA/IrrE family metallo-endopeptidase [Liquorilactobacillus sicerae]
MNQVQLSLLKIAQQQQITVIWSDQLANDTPPLALIKKRVIIMNLNWSPKTELTFQLAHELAHFFNNEPYYDELYQTGKTNLLQIEAQTNKCAIKLLLPFYLDDLGPTKVNAWGFIEQFGIPTRCLDLVQEVLHDLQN